MSDLYVELKQDLLRFALSISRNEHEAQDLVQDSVLKAMDKPEVMEFPFYKQRAWFFRVMKNRMIDERRKEKRITEWEDDFEFTLEEVAVSHLEITEMLSHLSKELSDLIFKRYWLGMTSQEIGIEMGVPASTIRYKLNLGIRKLRAIAREEK